jgi:adenosylhomocysteine nucleosidase
MAVFVLVASAACHPPAARGPSPAATPVVAMISANAEWKIILARFPGEALNDTPYGQWFVHRLGGEDVVWFHGGYGKVAAAGSTQYAIERWHPRLLVNLGTCGGFGGERKVGDIVLANETYLYDIVEMMGDPDEAIEDFHTRIDVTAWPVRLRGKVAIGPIVSADRDLDPAAVDALHAKFHTSVGDWESSAIAWVAAHNRTRAVILRGVTDLVDAKAGDPTYHVEGAWERASIAVMGSLVDLLADALPDLLRAG